MKTILVPTDFTIPSVNAARYATDLAVAIDARLVLLHVFFIPVTINEAPVVYVSPAEIEADAREKIKRLAKELSERAKGKIKVRGEIKNGNVRRVIGNFCKEINPDMVVMGPETLDSVERLLFGGETVSAIGDLTVPLLVVPANAIFNGFQKIGIASDFKDVVQATRVKEIKELVKTFGASLHVLHVSKNNEKKPALIFESGLFNELFNDLKPAYHFIYGNEFEESINLFAINNKLDLVIIIPKHHNLAGRVFHQSHTKELVLNADIPVMSIHE